VKKTATWQVARAVPDDPVGCRCVHDYQYYSYPCGKSTCTGSQPVTQYRSEPRSVTQYRTEERSEQYDATESRAQLSAQVNLFVDLRPLAQPLGTVVREDQVETGLTHSGVPAASLPASTPHVRLGDTVGRAHGARRPGRKPARRAHRALARRVLHGSARRRRRARALRVRAAG